MGALGAFWMIYERGILVANSLSERRPLLWQRSSCMASCEKSLSLQVSVFKIMGTLSVCKPRNRHDSLVRKDAD